MSLTHQQVLIAAEGLLLILLLIPPPAHSLQQNWVDQIAQRVQTEHDSIRPEHVEFYLTQLQAVRQALGALVCLGRRTLSRIIWTNGGQLRGWAAEYFLHSRSEWDEQELFVPILKRALPFCPGRLIGVAVDVTHATDCTITGCKAQSAAPSHATRTSSSRRTRHSSIAETTCNKTLRAWYESGFRPTNLWRAQNVVRTSG